MVSCLKEVGPQLSLGHCPVLSGGGVQDQCLVLTGWEVSLPAGFGSGLLFLGLSVIVGRVGLASLNLCLGDEALQS